MNNQIIFLVLFGIVFYVFILLPQTKKAKAQKKFRDELKKGDSIVTNGGIHGSILEVKDLTVLVDVGGGVKLKLDKSAINQEATALLEKSNQN